MGWPCPHTWLRRARAPGQACPARHPAWRHVFLTSKQSTAAEWKTGCFWTKTLPFLFCQVDLWNQAKERLKCFKLYFKKLVMMGWPCCPHTWLRQARAPGQACPARHPAWWSGRRTACCRVSGSWPACPVPGCPARTSASHSGAHSAAGRTSHFWGQEITKH